MKEGRPAKWEWLVVEQHESGVVNIDVGDLIYYPRVDKVDELNADTPQEKQGKLCGVQRVYWLENKLFVGDPSHEFWPRLAAV